jgi:hypothetical protein
VRGYFLEIYDVVPQPFQIIIYNHPSVRH